MIDECACDFDWTPEPRKMVTAVLAHPIHGRLVEKVMMMVNYIICYKKCFYSLSWRSGDVAYYKPVYGETVTDEGCGCAH